MVTRLGVILYLAPVAHETVTFPELLADTRLRRAVALLCGFDPQRVACQLCTHAKHTLADRVGWRQMKGVIFAPGTHPDRHGHACLSV